MFQLCLVLFTQKCECLQSCIPYLIHISLSTRDENVNQALNSMSFDSVHDLLEENHHMMILELCFRLQATYCGRTSVHKIVHDVLSFWKL